MNNDLCPRCGCLVGRTCRCGPDLRLDRRPGETDNDVRERHGLPKKRWLCTECDTIHERYATAAKCHEVSVINDVDHPELWALYVHDIEPEIPGVSS